MIQIFRDVLKLIRRTTDEILDRAAIEGALDGDVSERLMVLQECSAAIIRAIILEARNP